MTVLGLLHNEGIAPSSVDAAVMAVVVPDLAPVFERLCMRYFNVRPLVVGIGTRTGVKIGYDNPRDVGADRIVDVVAALRYYGPAPLIIVDLGTATVFDAVSEDGEYLGGALAPVSASPPRPCSSARRSCTAWSWSDRSQRSAGTPSRRSSRGCCSGTWG